MSYDSRKLKILDLATVSSSVAGTDFLRMAVGGTWNYFSESEGSGYSFHHASTEDGEYSNELIKNI